MLHQKNWGMLLASLFIFCAGLLRAQPVTYNVGNGNIVNDIMEYPAPYGNYFWGARNQFLVSAAELQALGATAGNVSAIGFDVAAVNGVALSNFEVKIGSTPVANLQTWETGLTSVFSAASYTETLGWNIHNFITPFTWDGVSNIVVETCFNNSSYTFNAGVRQSVTTFNSSIFYSADLGGVCASNLISLGAPIAQRPNIAFIITSSNIPCVDPPTAGQTIASLTSACPSDLVSLSLSGNSFGTGQTYQWQSSPDNLAWTDIAGATNPAYTTSIAADTYFRCVLTCGTGSASSASVMVQANQWFNCYCAAGSNAITCDEFIANVQVGAFSNPSACGVAGYTDFSILSIPMQIGVDNTVTIANGVNLYPQDQCGVWIDWNRDGSFDPITEAVTVNGTPGAGPYTAIVNPPLSVTPGNTVMRIRIAYTGLVDPCGFADWGEVEDYTIDLLPPPPCSTPTGLNLSAGGSVTSTIDWADIVNASSGYLVRYKLISDPTTVSTWANPTAVSVSEIVLTGLIPNGQYEIQVAADCAADGQSNFSASFNFGTNCPNTDCPVGAISENEACGADNNGGCNSPGVPSYTSLNCGDKVCGFSWADGGTRDTDWYTFTLTQPSTVTWSIQSDFPAIIGFVDASQGCAAAQFFNLTTTPGECAGASTFDNLPAGTWWVFVAPYTFYGYPCGSGKNTYWAELSCAPLVTAANDDCAAAISLTQNTTCQPTPGSVANATQSLAGCVGTANDDVWYSFVATTTNAVVEVDGAGLFDAVIEVFDACGGISLTCSNVAGAGQAETAVLSGLTVGQTYFFRVYDFGLGIPSIPNFDVCVYDAPPVLVITTPTITTCNGFFYDSGVGADYLDNEAYTSTIYPAVAGNAIQAAFTGFSIENTYDFLYIYDGTSIAAPLIGTYTGTNSPGIVNATNIDGALTFRFTSDFSVTEPGWVAEISCISPTAVPNCVSNILPVNGATGVSNLVNLLWQASAGPITTGYDVYFGTSSNPSLVSANQTATSYNPGALTPNTTYYWKVIAKNANGDAVGCNEYTFTTGTASNIVMGTVQSVSTCSATFYDSGINGNYQNSENSVLTISPDQANSLVQLDFALFNTQVNLDVLSIYDGLTTAAPLIGTYSGTTSPGIVNATNPDGALTIQFVSSATVALAGWQAAVSCITSQSPPTCATNFAPVNLATNVNPFVTLSWSPGSGVPPTGYDVYFGTAPNPPLVSANQTGTSYSTGALTVSTTYYWKVVPKNASGDAVGCTEQSFTTAANLVYCSAGATTCDEFISGVNVGTINNVTGCGLVGGYSDYTAISTQMAQGLGYPVVINNGLPTYTADQCGVWVDWNQDGDFYDAGEAVTILNTPGTGPYNGIVTVPPTALLGNTRMRVRITYTGIVDPCGVTTYGEVEDYTIQVIPAPTCPYPSTYSVSNITTTSADLNWSAIAGAVSYNVRYKAVADPTTVPTWSTPTVVNAPSTTLSVTGLLSGTDYEYQVETDCGSPTFGFGFSTFFSTNCGNTVCPANALVETEACGSDLNGGCNMTVPNYDPIACGDTICGTAWANANTRDTDWFTFTLTQPSTVTWTVDADFPALIGFVDASQGCAAPQFFNLANSTGECSQVVTLDNLAAGTWWVFVATQVFNGYPCGSGRNNYVASLNCTPLVVADNDECSTAMMLTQQSSCNPTADSVANATQSLPGCSGTANDDVWFSFVATSTNPIVEVAGSSGFDAVVQVFTACNGTALVCEDATFAGEVEVAQLNGLTVGNTYYIRVYDWDLGIPATTGFTICVYDTPPPPVNDDCSGAIAIGCNQSVSGNTSFANPEAANVGACGTSISAPGLWYSVTGNGNSITASMCTGTTYDSKLNIYSGDCSNLICVAGNDDSCGVQAGISWTSVAGQTYYILVQGFNGNTGPFTLSINHRPTVPVVTVSGNTTFCQGDSVNLTSDVSGVVWSDASTNQSLYVSQSGDYFATLTDLAGCVTSSDTTTVDVLPTPAAPSVTTSGNTTFCSGSSVTFTSSYLTGNTWSNNDTSNAIVANAAGSYFVTYTAPNGCTSSSQPISVTVNPNPPTPVAVPQGNTSICPGSSVDITSSVASGISWSNGSTNQTITVSNPGCFSVTVTDANNCSSVSLPVCVTVLPAPQPTVTPNGSLNICGGSSVDLVASSAGATFTWNGGQSGSTLTVSNSGDYYVTATYSNGCTAVSDTVTLNIFPAAQVPSINPSGNTTFCQGGSVTLSATPGVSFLWSNNSTGASITVNTAGSYSVTATDANGCTAVSQPVQVVVNPNPTVSIAANGPTTFCQGGALTITSSSSVGNLWSNGDTAQSVIVSASGNFSAVVTDVNGCTASSNTITVTVDSVPGALITSSGPLSVCNGGSVTLNANPGNAASYLWSNFSTGASLNVTQAGTYFVTITGANGCSSVSPSVTVVSGSVSVPFITAGGPTIICEGQTVTLLSSSPTGNVWSTGETTESIDVDSTGNYAVTVTDANGCSATSAFVQVIVNPQPTASFTANAQVGGLVTFTNTSGSFVSSQWDFGDGSALSNATNPVHTYSSDGTYNVILTVFNSCGSASITQQVSIIGTGIDDFEAGQAFNVYPNPSSGAFNLEFNGGSNETIRVQITDASGRLIWLDASSSPVMNYKKQINLDGIAKGVYFLRLNAGDRSVTRRIIVQ